jgi:hypothetical protein
VGELLLSLDSVFGKFNGSRAFRRVPLLLAGNLLGKGILSRSSSALAGDSFGLGKTGFLAAVLFSFSLSGNYVFTLPDTLIPPQI